MSEGSFTNPTIARFDSLAAFMEDFRARGAKIANKPDWTGETREEVRSSVENGNVSAVPKAEALLDKVSADLALSGLAPRWGRSVVGAFPDVPAFLGGAPECMLRRSPDRGPLGAINVYYSPITAAVTTPEESFRYGVTVLAAVMALSRVRPVNVYYFTPLGIGDHVIRLRTDPMVLSESAYILTSAGFYRSVSYEYAHGFGWEGSWGAWVCSSVSRGPGQKLPREEKIAHMKKILGLGEDDVLVPPVDPKTMREMSDPVAWVNGLLAKYR